MLSLREVSHGQGPDLCVIITVTRTRQGACVHQLRSQGIVMAQGTRQGTKQMRSLPSGAPSPIDEEESKSLGTAFPDLYMLTLYPSDQFSDVGTPTVSNLQVSKLSL